MQKRRFTDAEHRKLRAALATTQDPMAKTMAWLQGSWQLASGLFCMAIFVWMVLVLIALLASDSSMGFRSPYRAHIVIGIALASGLLAAILSYREIRNPPAGVRAMQADLVADTVHEEPLEVREVKRFQEPEHGGLLYFLKLADGRVYVLFDHESQDLGAQGQDPLKSSFAPKSLLTVARLPQSEIALSSDFSGEALALSAPKVLELEPDVWPQPDAFCAVPWEQLEEHFGATDAAAFQPGKAKEPQGFSRGFKIIVGVFALLGGAVMSLWATSSPSAVRWLPSVFLFSIAAAAILPRKIALVFGYFVALCVLAMAAWMLYLGLSGQEPLGTALGFSAGFGVPALIFLQYRKLPWHGRV